MSFFEEDYQQISKSHSLLDQYQIDNSMSNYNINQNKGSEIIDESLIPDKKQIFEIDNYTQSEIDSKYIKNRDEIEQSQFKIKFLYEFNKKINLPADYPTWYLYHSESKSSFGPLSSIEIVDLYNKGEIDQDIGIRLIDVFCFFKQNPFSYTNLYNLENKINDIVASPLIPFSLNFPKSSVFIQSNNNIVNQFENIQLNNNIVISNNFHKNKKKNKQKKQNNNYAENQNQAKFPALQNEQESIFSDPIDINLNQHNDFLSESMQDEIVNGKFEIISKNNKVAKEVQKNEQRINYQEKNNKTQKKQMNRLDFVSELKKKTEKDSKASWQESLKTKEVISNYNNFNDNNIMNNKDNKQNQNNNSKKKQNYDFPIQGDIFR